MNLIVFSFISILLFGVVHVLLWHFFTRLRGISTLVFISTAILAFMTYIGIAISIIDTIWDFIIVVQFHIFVTFSYIIGYSGIEQESPSLMILKLISNAEGNGVRESAINNLINDDFFIDRRLMPMLQAGLINQQNEIIMITPKGMLLSGIFHYFRKLTGTRVGA